MARRGGYVIGLENVLARIQSEMMAVRGRTYHGMIAAMEFLENKMDTENPVVPISNEKKKKKNKKHMRDTWFITGSPHPTNPIVFAGYTAPYAPIVHEMEEWRGPVNWTRPGSGQKWLQIHYDRNRAQMLLIVAQNAKVPGTLIAGGLPRGGVSIANRTNERSVIF